MKSETSFGSKAICTVKPVNPFQAARLVMREHFLASDAKGEIRQVWQDNIACWLQDECKVSAQRGSEVSRLFMSRMFDLPI
jgi:hypothetical protein